MKIIERYEDIRSERPTAVTLGKFDGLHRAHRMLIDTVAGQHEAAGLTVTAVSFDINPIRILTKEEKADILSRSGVELYIRLPFTAQLMSMEAEDFIEEVLIRRLHASYICVGDDFRFGHMRKGNAAMLAEAGEKYGFRVYILPAVKIGDREISSTWIRECMEAGDMETAADLLGFHYFLSGSIVHGRAVGRTIGVPTINMIPDPEKLLPKYGVYFSRNTIGEHTWYGITNIGTKPTVNGQFAGAETYLFGCSSDLYGETAKTELLRFMRPEIRFGSMEALADQLRKDMENGRKYAENMA